MTPRIKKYFYAITDSVTGDILSDEMYPTEREAKEALVEHGRNAVVTPIPVRAWGGER